MVMHELIKIMKKLTVNSKGHLGCLENSFKHLPKMSSHSTITVYSGEWHVVADHLGAQPT